MRKLKLIDTNVINQFKNGNQTSFKLIYDCFAADVYRFAFSFLKDKANSEEVVQETFIVLWENRTKFDELKAFEPYIFTISKRLVLDSLRKQTSTSKLRAQLLTRISDITNETESDIIYQDLMSFAESAVQTLPQQQQIVFRLSRNEGLSLSEISERLAISEHTVKNHLVVALKKLKTQFLSKEITCFWLLIFSLI